MLAQLSHAGFSKEVWQFMMTRYDDFLERYFEFYQFLFFETFGKVKENDFLLFFLLH